MGSRIFTHIAAFVLFALMLFKVSSFHIYTHQDGSDTIENCETCYFSFQNQQVAFSTVSVLILTALVLTHIDRKITAETTTLLLSPILPYTLFGRPPPSLR
ncbi:hypothetical protein [Maribacter flavus]|uniref:Uncharacterized protein n=1 Tax=Maribacter flavus TaxID=1658664 RepID=A0A5B2TSL8_9FLAO|nr:hypothetical protein [Maribacter flavus]KAA2217123.1 hypothetical protein F0361_14210 [Maribacter flavus]